MKWSVRIGRIAGIDVKVHATFLILIGWLVLNNSVQGRGMGSLLSDIVLTILLFGIIVLHELGHALTARRFGVGTSDITLLPIGGVARLERIPEDPKQELLVALAGPAVNFVLAALLFAAITIQSSLAALGSVSFEHGALLPQLFWINIFLAVFNLLPAFPMDGGRAFRALLAMKVGRVKATDIAASVGQALAFVFGFLGFFFNPFLLFIAFFVWIGAESEANQVRVDSMLHGVLVSSLMSSDFKVLQAREPLGEAARDLVPGFQTEFPVMDDGNLVGVIAVDNIVRGIREASETAVVGEFMLPVSMTAAPSQKLDEVLTRWREAGMAALPVVDAHGLVGLVTSSNVGEYVMIQSAMRSNGRTLLQP